MSLLHTSFLKTFNKKTKLVLYWIILWRYYYILCVFRSNHHRSWKFHKFHRKKLVLESLFCLKMTKLNKDLSSAWISHTSDKIDLKNTIDLLLFYREDFYGFLESDLYVEKNFFHNASIYRSQTFLFCTYCTKFIFILYVRKGLFCPYKQLLCLYDIYNIYIYTHTHTCIYIYIYIYIYSTNDPERLFALRKFTWSICMILVYVISIYWAIRHT